MAALTGCTSIMLAGNKAPVAAKSHPMPKSVFVMPTNPKQGRDPFFPLSTRVYDQMLAATHTNQVVELPSFTLLGISGTPGHLLAIINNHSFAKGDAGYVLTSSGKRVHIRCVEVGPNHAVVEYHGQKHRINMGNP